LRNEHVFDTLVDMSDPAEITEIDERLDVVAGHLNTQHALLVELASELEANRSWWTGPGVHTVEQYLCWRTGISPERARQIVQIASRADELPATIGVFRRGELGFDQMTAIARRAPWWTDEQMAALAPRLTVTQLRRTLAAYPFPDGARCGETNDQVDGEPTHDEVDPPGTSDEVESSASSDAAGAGAGAGAPSASPDGAADDDPTQPPDRPRDRGWYGVGDDGRFRLWFETDAGTGQIISAALAEARDQLFRRGQHDVGDVDALREVAERSLDHVTGAARRDRYRVHVHLRADGQAVDQLGAALPDEIRRYITCDGLVSTVLTESGIPVSVGRTQRIVPERTRRLVILRDQGCRVPGCHADRFLEVHHIVHWDDDGLTETWNLVALCSHHHRMHHRGELGIAGNADQPDGVAFTNRHGRPIVSSGARPRPPGAPPPEPIGTYRHPLGERLQTKWLDFRPPASAHDIG
jgi:Domain of unknown function (DUF222)/HNH endonuclease